ncbi:MAG: von Willebrand factor type A domain-containing protein, partial [Alistipes sp.]|nr:von Willebrand factor type A domain-containing protein [Alistipes sp.]
GKPIDTRSCPVSSFGLDVGTSSYQYINKTLHAGELPQPSKVAIEQIIDHFAASVPPDGGEVLGITTQVGDCPWNGGNRLVIITVATTRAVGDAKVEVRFDPKQVKSYMLLGYQDGGSQPVVDNNAPGEYLASGSRTVAIYEIVPAGALTGELMNVKVTYREEGQKRQKKRQATVRAGGHLDGDYNLYATAAWLGKLLRESAPKSQ